MESEEHSWTQYTSPKLMFSRMLTSANIPGYFTNHSLRRTATTRLFNAHVDEQLFMSRTGHSSSNGVGAYKRASEQFLMETSDVLNRKKLKIDCDKENVIPQAVLPSSLPFSFCISSSTVTFNINMSKTD